MGSALVGWVRGLSPLFVLVWLVSLAGLGRAEPAPPGPALALAVEHTTTPRTLCPGEARRVTVRLRNAGTRPWSPEQRDFVAYHWWGADGPSDGPAEEHEAVVWDGDRSPLPGPVTPGASVEVVATLRAPPRPGPHRLQWALVREGVQWVEGASLVEVEVAGAGPALAWSRVAGGEPESLRVGEQITVPVRLRNDGCAAWSPAQSDALAYHWYDAEGRRVVIDGERTPLPGPVAPGASVEVAATLRAPPAAGIWALQWRPVREGVQWFPEGDPPVGVPPVWVPVQPPARAWSVQVLDTLSVLGVDEVRDVSLWLRNEGEQPWSHERGDALSYRWYDAAGQPVAEGPRTRLPSPWLPGDAAVVEARLVAPEQPGRHRLVWELVREGVAWYGPPTMGEAEAWVEVTGPRLAWALVHIEPLDHVWAQRRRTVQVVLRNTGLEPWSPQHGDRLSYRWYDEDGRPVLGDGDRTVLPHAVPPGDEVVVAARVRGPPRPGRYTLRLEMVREHVRWYGPPTEGSAERSVRVLRWSSYWVVLVGVAGLLGCLALRRGGARSAASSAASSPAPSLIRWLGWRLGPALWAGAATAVLVHCFADLSGIEPWRSTGWIAVGPAGLVALVLIPLPPRAQAWGGALLVLGLALLALADLAYLHFFGSIVPLAAVAAVHHLVDAEATVSSLLRPAHGWLLALPSLALLLAAAWPRRPPGPPPFRPRRWLALVVAALLLLAMPLVRTLVQAFASTFGGQVFSERDNVGRLGVVGAHLFAALREVPAWLGPHAPARAQREILALARAQAADRRTRASARAPGFGAARGYDVLIIQVEALQGWVIGARVQGQAITPFLEAASAEALYFDQVFDQTAQGRTSDAEYLVLASGHPPARGALAFLHPDNEFYTLAHVLADAGYHTQSAHPYARGFWNRAHLHPRYGFAQSWFRRELGPGPRIGWGLTDATFFERMLPHLRQAPAPSLTFLVTLSLHHPYEDFPDAFKQLDLGPLEGEPVGNYLHAMHHFDGALADLLAALRREGRLRRTLVVVYGDHVTGLGESPPVLSLAGRPTWDPAAHVALHRVPVLVWVGDRPPAELVGRWSTVGGQIDIGATVLHLLGRSDPRPAAWGRTLLDPDPGFAALSDGSAVDEVLVHVARGAGIGREGGCFERPSGRSVELLRCAPLRDRAREELEAARLVPEFDLQRTDRE